VKKSLTWEQKRVVAHERGHALVKAVPGSGKTTTLIKRIERLIKSGVDRREILVLMFNKEAQESFSAKLKIALKSELIPQVSTFHAYAMKVASYGDSRKILSGKKVWWPDDQRLYDLKVRAFQEGSESEPGYMSSEDIRDFGTYIDNCRARGITASDVALDPVLSNDANKHYVGRYIRYCELLDEYGIRTLECLLIDACKVMRKSTKGLSRFQHIIVDEYQDVNNVQHTMLRLIARQNSSVMAVGDVNQCIYQWRGSCPDFIAGLFERDFHNTTTFHLSCTFRFGHELSLIANSVIRRNPSKLTKLCISHPSTPKTETQIDQDGDLPTVLANLSGSSRTKAILSRTRAGLAEAELILRLSQLPYRYIDGKDSSGLHNRNEVGVLVVGMAIAVYGNLSPLEGHPRKRDLLRSFLWESGFKLEKKALNNALSELSKNNADLWPVLSELAKGNLPRTARLEKIKAASNKVSEDTPAHVAFSRLELIGLFDALGSTDLSQVKTNDKQRGLLKFKGFLEQYKISVRQFLDLVLQSRPNSEKSEAFELATIHKSKGLEWDDVVLVDLCESEFSGDPNSSESEEERRLFYVGITRSKRRLRLVVPPDERLERWINNGWDSTPKFTPIASHFVYESGWTSCQATSKAIYSGANRDKAARLNGFHRWYLASLSKLRV